MGVDPPQLRRVREVMSNRSKSRLEVVPGAAVVALWAVFASSSPAAAESSRVRVGEMVVVGPYAGLHERPGSEPRLQVAVERSDSLTDMSFEVVAVEGEWVRVRAPDRRAACFPVNAWLAGAGVELWVEVSQLEPVAVRGLDIAHGDGTRTRIAAGAVVRSYNDFGGFHVKVPGREVFLKGVPADAVGRSFVPWTGRFAERAPFLELPPDAVVRHGLEELRLTTPYGRGRTVSGLVKRRDHHQAEVTWRCLQLVLRVPPETMRAARKQSKAEAELLRDRAFGAGSEGIARIIEGGAGPDERAGAGISLGEGGGSRAGAVGGRRVEIPVGARLFWSDGSSAGTAVQRIFGHEVSREGSRSCIAYATLVRQRPDGGDEPVPLCFDEAPRPGGE